MADYQHLSEDGVWRQCKAQPGNCALGDGVDVQDFAGVNVSEYNTLLEEQALSTEFGEGMLSPERAALKQKFDVQLAKNWADAAVEGKNEYYNIAKNTMNSPAPNDTTPKYVVFARHLHGAWQQKQGVESDLLGAGITQKVRTIKTADRDIDLTKRHLDTTPQEWQNEMQATALSAMSRIAESRQNEGSEEHPIYVADKESVAEKIYLDWAVRNPAAYRKTIGEKPYRDLSEDKKKELRDLAERASHEMDTRLTHSQEELVAAAGRYDRASQPTTAESTYWVEKSIPPSQMAEFQRLTQVLYGHGGVKRGATEKIAVVKKQDRNKKRLFKRSHADFGTLVEKAELSDLELAYVRNNYHSVKTHVEEIAPSEYK